MNDLVIERLKIYKTRTPQQEKEALRELIQEITLLGLWRSKFFEHAAFYGGTALRILYNLDRFSEDLDFTAFTSGKNAHLDSYLNAVKTELAAFGFETTVERKPWTTDSTTDSAFIKADTERHLIAVGSKFHAQKGELLKIKFEVDMDPAPGFITEARPFFWPQVFSVVTCDLPSLFAGKLHAAFCRKRIKNVKGRDWYDFLWYISRGVQPNYIYLENKLRQSNHWADHDDFTVDAFKIWAKDRLAQFDIEAAKNDVARFISDPRKLDGWNEDVFIAAIDRL
jgi:predicted nucleotidyltransferase component of viral defense system